MMAFKQHGDLRWLLILIPVLIAALVTTSLYINPTTFDPLFTEPSEEKPVIDQSEITLPLSSISTTDFLVVDGQEHEIDRETIDGIIVTKHSEQVGGITKVIYIFTNTHLDSKEIQFLWRSEIDGKYTSINDFSLKQNFQTTEPELNLYEQGTLSYFLTFQDILTSFGGVELSFDSSTRTLTATSPPKILQAGEELVMDPGGGDAPTITYNTPANNSAFKGGISGGLTDFLNITVADDQNPLFDVRIYGSNRTEPLDRELLEIVRSPADGAEITFNWSVPLFEPDSDTLVFFHFDNNSDFGEGTSDGIVYDFSNEITSSTHNGTAGSGTSFSETGKIGGGHAFGGSGSQNHVTISDANALDLTSNFTIMGWAYDNATSGVRTIISKGTSPNVNYQIDILPSAKIRFVIQTTGDTINAQSDPVPLKEWFHFAAVYNGTTGAVYVNGELQAAHERTGTPKTNAGDITIGSTNADTNLFNGSMDEFAIIDRALTGAEIKNLTYLENGTYYWYAKANDGSLTTTGGTNRIFIGSNPTTATPNEPLNRTNFTSRGGIILNATIYDEDGTAPLVRIFGSNSSVESQDRLLYKTTDVSNASDITYNWTALPLVNESDIQVLYHFDNNTDFDENDTYVSDFARDYNGSITGARYNFTDAMFGGAMQFDGNDMIEIANDFDLYKTRNATYMFWVTWNDTTVTSPVLGTYNTVLSKGLSLGLDAGVNITVTADTDAVIQSPIPIEHHRWYHLAFVNSDNKTFTLYIDGVWNASGSYDLISDVTSFSAPVLVGRLGLGDALYHNGLVDDLAIINRSLNASDIRDVYQLGEGQYYWHVEGGDKDGTTPTHSGAFTFLLDITPPSIPEFVSPTPADTSNLSQSYIEVNITVNETNPYNCILEGIGSNVTGDINGTENPRYCFFNQTNLSDGTFIYRVYVNDTSGQMNVSADRTVSLDTGIPSLISNSPTNNTNFSSTDAFSFNISIEDSIDTELTLQVFGSNSTPPVATQLLYLDYNAANGSNITFNWTAPVLTPDDDYLMLLHLDRNSDFGENDTHVYDFANSEENGTVYGNLLINRTGGYLGGGAQFTQTGDERIDFGDNDSLIGIMNISYVAWLKPGDLVGNALIIFKRGFSVPITGFDILQSDDNITIRDDDAALSVGGYFNTNEWVHMAVTLSDNGTVDLYRNGILNSSGTVDDITSNNQPFLIGNSKNLFGNYEQAFNGTIDEVAVINRTLTASEVLDMSRLKDDAYFWTVNVTDAAGNVNSSEIYQFGLDQTSPDSLTFVSPTITNDTNTSDSDFVANITFTELFPSGCIFDFFGGNISTQVNTSSTDFQSCSYLLGMSNGDGVYTLVVYANDTVGNLVGTENRTFTLDTTKPAVIDPQTNDSDDSVDISEVFNLNVTVNELYIKNVTVKNTTTLVMINESGVWKLNTTGDDLGCSDTLPTCILTFNASDYAGNENTSVTLTLTFDTTNPAVTITSPAAGNTSSSTTNFNATVLETNPNNATVAVVQINPDSTDPYNRSLTNYSGNWGFANTSMPDDRYVATFMIDDEFGNMNNSEQVIFTVDVTPPTIDNVTVNNSQEQISPTTFLNITANITDTNRPEAPANISGDDGATNVPMTLKHDNTFSVETTPTALGCDPNAICTITVYFRDAAGNLGTGTVDKRIVTDEPFVATPQTYNASLIETSTFTALEQVIIRANITDGDGRENIARVYINITDPVGKLQPVAPGMEKVDQINHGFTYSYTYTTESIAGEWSFLITAFDNEGKNGTNTGTFRVQVPGIPKEHSLNITLNINNTVNTVFIPGVGEVDASELPSVEYTSPPEWFLASYLNNNLKALVFSQEIPITLAVSTNTTHHFLTLDENLTNSQLFMVFTEGDYLTIENKIPSVESGTFLSSSNPSFAYPTGGQIPLKLSITFENIDLQGVTTIEDQEQNLIIEDLGTVNNKEVISIEVVR